MENLQTKKLYGVTINEQEILQLKLRKMVSSSILTCYVKGLVQNTQENILFDQNSKFPFLFISPLVMKKFTKDYQIVPSCCDFKSVDSLLEV